MTSVSAIPPPSDVHVLTLYDPFVLKTPDPAFFVDFDEYDSALDQRMFAELCESGAIRDLYVVEPTKAVRALCRIAGIEVPTESPVHVDVCTSADSRRRAVVAASHDYLSFLLTVTWRCAKLIDTLRRWPLLQVAPQQSVWSRAYDLPTIKLFPETWQRIAAVVQSFPEGIVGFGFGNEGTMLAIFGRPDDLSRLAEQLRTSRG